MLFHNPFTLRTRRELSWALFILALYFLVQGYIVGSGDQVEIAGTSIYPIADNALSQDLFIQSQNALPLHIRSFFVGLLRLFLPYYAPATLLLHILSGLFLIMGMFRLTRWFLKDFRLKIAVPVFVLILFNGITLSSNTLFANNLQASNIAHGFALWGLTALLNRNYPWASLLAAFATLFQPLVGIQFMLIVIVGALVQLFVNREGNGTQAVFGLAIYGFFGLPYVLYLRLFYDIGWAEHLTPEHYYKALIVMRHAHHYLPAYFSDKGWLLFGALSLFSFFFYRRNSPTLMAYFVFFWVGAVIYTFFIWAPADLLGYSWKLNAATTQWFRMAVWIKLLGFIGLMVWLERIALGWFHLPIPRRLHIIGPAAAGTGLLLAVGVYFGHAYFPWAEYHFGRQTELYEPLKMARIAQEQTPERALFVHPPYYTALKYYGRRSSYVDYKAVVRNPRYLERWLERIEQVYGLDPLRSPMPGSAVRYARQYYRNLGPAEVETFIDNGVTHIITEQSLEMPQTQLLASTDNYYLYKLAPQGEGFAHTRNS